MFDFGLSEMLLAGVVALIVLGPERLPVVARTAGRWFGKIQAFAAGVKQELNRSGGLDELKSVKADFEEAAQSIRTDWQDIKDETENLPAWERLPEMKMPADFGVDEAGNPLPEAAASADDTGAGNSIHAETVRSDNIYTPSALPRGHMVSLQRQAVSRKRDMRPRYRVKPKLRARR